MTAVLSVIQEYCEEPDVFKILDADDILSKLPETLELTKEDLSQVIKDLKDRELIKVKYFTLNEYCLSCSVRAKIEREKREEEIKVEEALATVTPILSGIKGGKKKVAIKSRGFWGAFLGAFLGGVVVFALYVILDLFVL
jgi:hypothetical protein